MNNNKLDPKVKRMFENEANKKAKKKQLVQKPAGLWKPT